MVFPDVYFRTYATSNDFFVVFVLFISRYVNKNKIAIVLKHCVDFEEFEDTKGVIRIRKSKKNRDNDQKKKQNKRTNSDLQNIHIKLKFE